MKKSTKRQIREKERVALLHQKYKGRATVVEVEQIKEKINLIESVASIVDFQILGVWVKLTWGKGKRQCCRFSNCDYYRIGAPHFGQMTSFSEMIKSMLAKSKIFIDNAKENPSL